MLLERLIVFQKPTPMTLYGGPKIAGSAPYTFAHHTHPDGRSIFSVYYAPGRVVTSRKYLLNMGRSQIWVTGPQLPSKGFLQL